MKQPRTAGTPPANTGGKRPQTKPLDPQKDVRVSGVRQAGMPLYPAHLGARPEAMPIYQDRAPRVLFDIETYHKARALVFSRTCELTMFSRLTRFDEGPFCGDYLYQGLFIPPQEVNYGVQGTCQTTTVTAEDQVLLIQELEEEGLLEDNPDFESEVFRGWIHSHPDRNCRPTVPDDNNMMRLKHAEFAGRVIFGPDHQTGDLFAWADIYEFRRNMKWMALETGIYDPDAVKRLETIEDEVSRKLRVIQPPYRVPYQPHATQSTTHGGSAVGPGGKKPGRSQQGGRQ